MAKRKRPSCRHQVTSNRYVTVDRKLLVHRFCIQCGYDMGLRGKYWDDYDEAGKQFRAMEDRKRRQQEEAEAARRRRQAAEEERILSEVRRVFPESSEGMSEFAMLDLYYETYPWPSEPLEGPEWEAKLKTEPKPTPLRPGFMKPRTVPEIELDDEEEE